MRRALRLTLSAGAALLLACALARQPVRAGEDTEFLAPAEPQSYRMDDYLAPTPLTLAGARVVSTAQAYDLWREGKTLFIDVMPRVVKPANLPATVLWRDKRHDHIPRSAWLPNVGYGKLNTEADDYFRRSLARLTGNDRNAPVLFYCKSECWMSWNAAKRAREEYGYQAVLWHPAGVDGWAAEGHALEQAQPEP
jgi:PQQ-dependent catabolism-associated CXXCW motif protein